jgi:hypothetical protein
MVNFGPEVGTFEAGIHAGLVGWVAAVILALVQRMIWRWVNCLNALS